MLTQRLWIIIKATFSRRGENHVGRELFALYVKLTERGKYMQHLNSQQTSKVHKTAELFEPTTINGMRLTNRFVRSATWEGLADEDGSVTKKLTEIWSIWPEVKSG